MLEVAVASGNQLAADAGARVAREGGNAVDAAIAASLVSCVVEPGVCSLAASGFLTIWPPGDAPVMIDGAAVMPGTGLPKSRFGQATAEVFLEYGGGMRTTVGHGSVAVPGNLAAYALASGRYGRVPWRVLVEPAWELARDGFPLSEASCLYLQLTHESIYGWDKHSLETFYDADGELYKPGSMVRIEHLDESLRCIADGGADEFYRGDLARQITACIEAHGGILTRRDMAGYQALLSPTLDVEVNDWTVATDSPPALGGAVLVAMLLLMGDRPQDDWTPAELEHLIRVQEAVLDFRYDHLDGSENLPGDVRNLLEQASTGDLRSFLSSPSTVHASAVDSAGLACSVTVSAGYGSGVLPPGTGIFMNNSLGELELNRLGVHVWNPGSRLPSNMAPTVARHRDGAVLAVGSPGASRITTAIQQTLVNFMQLGMPLQAAVDHARLHVEEADGHMLVAYEEALPVHQLDVPQRMFPGISMYFGGVSAALWDPREGFVVAADPRRAGGTALSGNAEPGRIA
ncbi:MAG: gamma-glutamyltransferase [Gammaproteobacteria bacterium]|nr:gamma-glutamyltransferase [Gammaproteobacteria bacterium]